MISGQSGPHGATVGVACSLGKRDRVPSSDETLDGAAFEPDGWALALSGGGYKAAAYHLGTLIRLNELGHLPRLKRVSSVSGGSITAAWLGLRWSALTWKGRVATNFNEEIRAPLEAFLTSANIDIAASAWALVDPNRDGGDNLASAYAKPRTTASDG